MKLIEIERYISIEKCEVDSVSVIMRKQLSIRGNIKETAKITTVWLNLFKWRFQLYHKIKPIMS